MADQITGRCGQGRLAGFLNVTKTLTKRLIRNLRVDIAMRAWHVAGAYGFAARSFHGVIDISRHLTLRHITIERAFIVVFMTQGQSISRAAGQKNLFAAHPTAHLRQAD